MKKDRWLFILPAIALLGYSSTQSSAQQAPDASEGVIQINVNLVRVDAVVTDSKGKPVTDLKADDFELLQDGKVQKIRNFEFVNDKATPASPSRPAPKLQAGGPQVSTPLPVKSMKPDQVRRTLAFVVDDIALSFNSVVQIREALKKWVNEQMQPGDMVSIVRTNAVMGSLQQFTNDKRILYAAIDSLKYQPGRIGVESFKPIAKALPAGPNGRVERLTEVDTTEFDSGLANAYLLGSLNAVRYVMQGLHDLPGRKSLILFSEDMQLNTLDTQRQSIENRLRHIADEANRSSVVIYAIDPRGGIYTGFSSSDNLAGWDPWNGYPDSIHADKINARFNQFNASQDGMMALTERTGGRFYSGENDLSIPVSKAVDDGDGYYLMGYQPDQKTFDAKMDTPKYHNVKVRVKRAGLTVRTREGFYGVSDAPIDKYGAQFPPTPQAQMAKALVSPFAASDLRVRLTALFSNSDKEGSSIETLLYFDTHDLTFTDAPDGSHTANVDIALLTFDEDGNPGERVNKTWTIRVSKEDYNDVLRKGMVYKAFVPIKKAGPFQLRAAVRDTASQKLGSAMQFIDVPDLGGGKLALSGIAMTADPLGEYNVEGTPAVRIFKPGEAVAYGYEVLNTQVNSSDKSQLQSQLRVYRDGEIVYERAPALLKAADEGNAKSFAVDGRLQLRTLPPGEYVMQVIVSDNTQKDKSRIASQTIDFEVRP